MPSSAQVAESEVDVLTQYSALMRDARKSKAVIELMDGFWREGLALAQERHVEIREAEAQREKVAVCCSVLHCVALC